jgi:membrane-bound lytic murein transglycosylase A
LRRTNSGALLPYYDRGEILDGALDGKHLEICWIKNQSDALTIQIQGSARVRLEDGAMLRINYDGYNGYPFVPLSRILIDRNIIPREEISLERIRDWVHANPQSAEELLRQNRSFMFFRIVGLSDDRRPAGLQEAPREREAIGAQGISLTAGRSIAVDSALHVYGTPFFIDADLPLTDEKRESRFDHLMIAQDLRGEVDACRSQCGHPDDECPLGRSFMVSMSLARLEKSDAKKDRICSFCDGTIIQTVTLAARSTRPALGSFNLGAGTGRSE